MHPSFVVAAAAVFGCLMPAALFAQSGARSEDLRTEIRRIVREEIHAALQEMHGEQAAPHAMPGSPARATVKAAPRAGNKVEEIDGEVQQMNALIEAIEKEVAKNEQNLQRLGVKPRDPVARPKAESEGHEIQLQLGEGGEGLHLQLGEGGEGGVHTFVIEDGELRAVGGDAQKAKAKKIAPPKKDGKRAAAGPGGEGVFQIELQEPQKKGKNKGKAVSRKPAEMRMENVEVRLQGDGEGHVVMLQGQPAGKAGCSCNCPCCGGQKATTGNPKAAQPRIMWLGGSEHGEAGNGMFQVRGKAGDDDDDDEEIEEVQKVAPPQHAGARAKAGPPQIMILEGSEHGEAGKGRIQVRGKGGDDDDDDEGEEVREVTPPKQAGAKAKAGPPHFMILGEPVRGEAGRGKIQVRAKAGDDEDDDEEVEEVQKVAPPAKPNPAPAATPAKPRVIRLGRLLV